MIIKYIYNFSVVINYVFGKKKLTPVQKLSGSATEPNNTVVNIISCLLLLIIYCYESQSVVRLSYSHYVRQIKYD